MSIGEALKQFFKKPTVIQAILMFVAEAVDEIRTMILGKGGGEQS